MFFLKKSRGAFFCDTCDKTKKVNKINTSRPFLAVTKLLQAVTNHLKHNKINVFYCDKEKLRFGKWGITCILKNIHTPFSRL